MIVLSDLFDDVDAMMAGLKHLRHRRHEVILMHVLDPAELDFPFDADHALPRPGAVCPTCWSSRGRLRKAYLAEFGRYLRRLKAGCRVHAHRLRADADRSVAGGGVVELFGVERIEISRLRLRLISRSSAKP